MKPRRTQAAAKRRRRPKGTDAQEATSRGWPANLNLANRRDTEQNRTSGGVGGVRRGNPAAPIPIPTNVSAQSAGRCGQDAGQLFLIENMIFRGLLLQSRIQLLFGHVSPPLRRLACYCVSLKMRKVGGILPARRWSGRTHRCRDARRLHRDEPCTGMGTLAFAEHGRRLHGAGRGCARGCPASVRRGSAPRDGWQQRAKLVCDHLPRPEKALEAHRHDVTARDAPKLGRAEAKGMPPAANLRGSYPRSPVRHL